MFICCLISFELISFVMVLQDSKPVHLFFGYNKDLFVVLVQTEKWATFLIFQSEKSNGQCSVFPSKDISNI